jgi:hypothetical protein
VLAAAAILKTHAVLRRVIGGDLQPTAHEVGLIAAELLFAAWLMLGIWSGLAWHVAVVVFFGFAAWSAFQASAGSLLCGCFGELHVSPWVAFAIDSAIVVLLLSFGSPHREHVVNRLSASHRVGVAAGLLILTLAGSHFASGLMRKHHFAGREVVILEPGEWIGRRFPLLDDLMIDAPITRGKWTLLLYRRDCLACARTLSEISAAAAGGERIAVIEVPSSNVPDVAPSDPAVVWGTLRDTKVWVVQTPEIIRLFDGVVIGPRQVEQILTPPGIR